MKTDGDRAAADRYAAAVAVVGTGSLARFASTAVVVIAGVTTTSLAVRTLGVPTYGRLAVVLSAVALLTAGIRLGTGTATVWLVSAGDEGAGMSMAAVLRGAASLVTFGSLGGLLLLISWQLVDADGLELDVRMLLAGGMALLLLGRAFATTADSIARGFRRIAFMELPNLCMAVTQLAAVAVVAGSDGDLGAVAIAYGVAGMLTAPVGAWVIARLAAPLRGLFRPSLDHALRLLKVAWPFALAGATTQLLAWFDVLVLGLTGSSGEVGLYEPTLRLTDRLMQLILLVVMALYLPSATRLFVQRDLDGFRALYANLTKLLVVLSAPALLLLAAFPTIALESVFGASFPVDTTVMRTLLVGYCIHLLFGLSASALLATGDRVAIVTVYRRVIPVVVLAPLILVPPFGPVGAALATAGSLVMLDLSVTRAVRARTGAHPLRPDVLIVGASLLIPVGLVLLGRQVVDVGSLWTAAGICAASWMLWIVALRASGRLKTQEFTPFFSALKSRRRVQGP